MKIHHELAERENARPLVLALGFFDGLHLGHREIVKTLLRLRRPGYRAAVLTFSNHPATHLRPERVPPLISTLEERINLLGSTGVDEVYLVPFDDRIARTDARAFLLEVLHEKLGVRGLVVGDNFRFGRGREGDATLARETLAPLGVEVVAVPPLSDSGERISSTRIRTALARGDLATANRLLGQPYALTGRVTLGFGRGHDLGFPTANLTVDPKKTLPADGVYSVVARYDGRDYSGLVSIGSNPTFAGQTRTVETWMLDFRRTIYGEELTLRDFGFIREQRRFDSVQALLQQMADDATHVRYPSFSSS